MAAASPKYKYIATGTEGMVVRPALPNINPETGAEVEFPDNVTKIFYNARDLLKAKSNFEKLEGLMGGKNASQRSYLYTKRYTRNNVNPASGLYNRHIRDTLIARGVKAGNKLHLLRMPDLGIDIHHIGTAEHMAELTQLKHVPFHVILEQFRKVFFQLQNLTANRHLHTDIRTLNVMINPESGVISIIDFGWLKPYDELFTSYFTSFGYYSNPPESLLLKIGTDPSVVVRQLLDESTSLSALIFGIPLDWINQYVSDNVTYVGLISDQLRYRTELSAALSDNIKYLREKADRTKDARTNFINAVFPTFDAYGLAITLLVLLKKVYAVNPMDMPADAETLSRHLMRQGISKGDEPYSEDEFMRMSSALIAVVGLFKRESSIKIRERMTPDAVVVALDEILAQYRGAPAAMGGAGAGAIPLGAAAPAFDPRIIARGAMAQTKRGVGPDVRPGLATITEEHFNGKSRRNKKLRYKTRRYRKN